MRKLLFAGILLHLIIGFVHLPGEVSLIKKDAPLLWGKTNEARRIIMFQGRLDSIENHEFINRCIREIPHDAEVLIISDRPKNVFIMNYYLYPRKTSVDKNTLNGPYWTLRYNTPKAFGLNSLEEPAQHDSSS